MAPTVARPSGYLIRLRERTEFLALKRQIVVGLVGGWPHWPRGLAGVERGIRAATGWIGKTVLLAALVLF